ncbi:hypothetical protein FS749_005763 [Ceratobasidium sp. UAMH 11750]|nr:hypothetical protein FS749_005763 [Ceratobasidium sp. UAMH 11750]
MIAPATTPACCSSTIFTSVGVDPSDDRFVDFFGHLVAQPSSSPEMGKRLFSIGVARRELLSRKYKRKGLNAIVSSAPATPLLAQVHFLCSLASPNRSVLVTFTLRLRLYFIKHLPSFFN